MFIGLFASMVLVDAFCIMSETFGWPKLPMNFRSGADKLWVCQFAINNEQDYVLR